MDLDSIMLIEVSQTEKERYYMIILNVETKKYNKLVNITKKSRLTDTENN